MDRLIKFIDAAEATVDPSAADPQVEPRPVIGDLLRQAFNDDYYETLRFELISLLLVLSHVPSDSEGADY